MTNWRATVFDMLTASPFSGVVFNRRRWMILCLILLLLVGTATGVGWLIAELDPLPVIALFGAVVVAGLFLYNIEIAYLGVFAIITLFPFGSLPFSIGFTPTFLDLALVGLYVVWLLPYVLGDEQRFISTPVGSGVAAFGLLAIAAFVAGLSHGVVTTYLIRHFAEVLLSIGSFFLVVNTVKDINRLQNIVRWLILATAAAAVIGIVLYGLPDAFTIRILSALARFGYPTGTGVLRYIRDDPQLMKRATSTSVDPNVLGSLLNMTIALTIPQLFAKRPILPRWLIYGCLAIMGLCLGLTISRGAMLGCAFAVGVISVLRYRKLLPLIILVLGAILVLPWTQELLLHFVEGFQLKDLSTQMRLGEYKDALILITRYPFLGVGFTGAPDIDIYVAVANVYLIIAAQMGLVGLTAFLFVITLVLVRFFKYRSHIDRNSCEEPLWYGLHAAILGGVFSGLFDHYFFSLDFHHSVTLFWMIVGLTTAVTELVRNDMDNRRTAQPSD
ncbi:MAG: O-antigen ligase family protein [Anaerolineae bacterium]|nr:O-antigen ligase family protein [Anaerolineae bacterium]